MGDPYMEFVFDLELALLGRLLAMYCPFIIYCCIDLLFTGEFVFE